MTDLFDRLQQTLGEDTYRLEKELGGGGMSQVFLATEVELGRKVVVKVLPPDMAAGVNKERFQREIKLAASLQHPHIVPLLTAGSAGDLIWYVMPFIEGESLRVKLGREGEMPLNQATAMLREVADALAYAHRHDVVHRDIKPDNVLLSEGHAVVMDFGVAKAVSASSGETSSSLTSLGVALGTPAYMSPEQAAADPHVDHRADIYAMGALAYEMLTGRPPFVKQTPQQVLAAQVNEQPDHITQHRETVPPDVAGTIMKCLAKRAADRWQTADELKAFFSNAPTPDSGGLTPTGTAPYMPAHRTGAVNALKMLVDTPLKLAGLFLGGAAFMLLFTYALVIAFGLPFWVFYGAVALTVIGFPIVMLTGRREQQAVEAYTTGLQVATPVGLEKHLTWKKALAGGGFAFAGLAVVAGGFMGMRSAGIGPAATLATSGALAEREPIVLAHLDNRTTDSSMGNTVTELLRVSLSQSPFVRLVDPARINESLARMQRDPSTEITETVALEIAERDAIKAVLAGDIVPLGSGFVISARLVAANGSVLTAHQASANSATEIMGAVDQIAAELRERMGESLRTIRRTVPIDLVTTGSIEALRLYTQAQNAENAGDNDRATALLERAIEEDSTFAMAYRKLGTILGNDFEQRARMVEALTSAYELRDRLTDLERGYAVAQYHTSVTGEREAAIAAYRTILESHPDDLRAINNTGVIYSQMYDWERALEYFSRAVDHDATWAPGWGNVRSVLTLLGRFEEAERTIEQMEELFPDNSSTLGNRVDIAYVQGDYERADSLIRVIADRERASLGWMSFTHGALSDLHGLKGQLREARRYAELAASVHGQRELPAERLNSRLDLAILELYTADDIETARSLTYAALEENPLEAMAVVDRDYEYVVFMLLQVGDSTRAFQYLDEFEASGMAEMGRSVERSLDRTRAYVELERGNFERGLELMRSGSRNRGCEPCANFDLSNAHDIAGNNDSTLYYLANFVDTYNRIRSFDATAIPFGLRRLGEIHESRGETEEAARRYGALLDLWENADAELQPQIDDIRRRLARLVGER